MSSTRYFFKILWLEFESQKVINYLENQYKPLLYLFEVRHVLVGGYSL